MKCWEFETFVEIPITVCAEAVKAEGDGWNSERIPAHIQISDIELPADLKNYIMEKYYRSFCEEAEGME